MLVAWSGLGYPRRAKALHDAATLIRDDFAGVVPERVDDLLRLPGVGRYTAHAVASFAFGPFVPRALGAWCAAEDRDLAVARGIGGLQRVEQISMTMMGLRGKCLRFRSEKMQFRVSYVNPRPNRSAAARWNGFRAQTRARSLRLHQILLERVLIRI